MVDPRDYYSAERAALQYLRLFRCCSQHLLWHKRQPAEPDRSPCARLYGEVGKDGPRRRVQGQQRQYHFRPESRGIHYSFAPAGPKGVPTCDASGGPSGGPLCDIYETDFTSGQRNIFRQSFQKRADISLQKVTNLSERYSIRYTFDVFNVTNTPSFDIPGNNTNIDPNFGSGTFGSSQVQPTGATQSLSDIYVFPTVANNGGLGVVNGLIGGPRVIEMSPCICCSDGIEIWTMPALRLAF